MRTENMKTGVHPRRAPGLCLILAALLALASCGTGAGRGIRKFQMGDRTQVGPFIYTVVDAEWSAQLGAAASPKLPSNRFLLVRLSVTNSGASEVSAPHLSLQDSKGKSYPELTDGAEVPDWLGVLRRLAPAETEQGRIAFDVPTGAYQLRLTDGGEPGQEKVALVEIPLRLEAESPTTPITPVPPPQAR